MSENTEVTVAMSGDTETNSMIEQEADFILIRQNGTSPAVASGSTEKSYHLWFKSTHYVDAGKADEVNIGDVFVLLSPEYLVHEITAMDVEPPEGREDDGEWVSIDLWDPETGEKDSQKFQIEHFTGLEDPAMGYTGPPTKFELATE